MLVLSRRPGDSVIVDHSILITVEVVAGDDVCLSVQAPPGTVIERAEDMDMATALSERGTEWDPSRFQVLSRRSRPAIVINRTVRVAILAFSHDVVRIGFDAPSNIEVHRAEVYRQIQAANQEAVSEEVGQLAGLAGLVRQER